MEKKEKETKKESEESNEIFNIKISIFVFIVCLIMAILSASGACDTKTSQTYIPRTTTKYYHETIGDYTKSYSDNKKSKSSSGSNKKSYDSDPYNIGEYADEHEFYYWNRDDFVDYEDAEDYYNEHNK